VAPYVARFFDANGNEVLKVEKTAAPGGAPNIYLPNFQISDGLLPGIYSGRVTADQPIGTIVRTDWYDTGAAGIYSQVKPGDDVIVPIVVRRHEDASSILVVQNDGDVVAEALVSLHRLGFVGDPELVLGPYEIPPGAARQIHLLFESELAGLDDFVGWARVTSSGAEVAVQSFAMVEPGVRAVQAVYAFEGVPLAAADSTLYVPLFRSHQRGFGAEKLDTTFAVVNPGDVAAEVSVTYHGTFNPVASDECRGGTFTHEPVVIPAGGSHLFEQGPGGAHDLPADCFGSAVIRTAASDQRVVATIIDATDGNSLLSAYNALPASEAGRRVALPLFRRSHYGLTTGIQAMNVSSEPVTVTLRFFATDPDTDESTEIVGCEECVQTLAPHQGFDWWPGRIPQIPNFTFGSATLSSTLPIVALVNDYPLTGQTDPATYIGIPAGE